MPRKQPPPAAIDLGAFDAALGAAVASGWDEPAPPRLDAVPAPLKEPLPPEVRAGAIALLEGQADYPPLPVDPDSAPEPLERSAEDGEGLPTRQLLNVGILTDLVAGSKTADQAAAAAGVTQDELHSALALTLTQVDPKEIAKAMGVQIAATQLKAGAVWNAILADLLADIRAGRAKPDVKLELLKILKGVGRLEPKEDKGVGAGSGFSLNINISAADVPKPVVIEAN